MTIEELTKKAKAGDAAAQVDLGWCYATGDGVTTDYKKAAELYEKAANKGFAAGERMFGACCYNGKGVPSDRPRAFSLFLSAAQKGDVQAQRFAGICFFNGHGTEKNLAEAFKWFSKAAQAGDAEAQNLTGAFYFNGWSVPVDIKKAADWFVKAAKQGNKEAQQNIMECRKRGVYVPVVRPDPKPSDIKPAEPKKEEPKKENLTVRRPGRSSGLGGSNEPVVSSKEEIPVPADEHMSDKAREYLEKAEAGDAQAMYDLGNSYFNADGVVQNYEKAKYWYEKAVEKGNTDAMLNLGFMYERGSGVPADMQKAIELYTVAAEAGDAQAQYNLAYYYYNTEDGKRDYKKAYHWYSECAKQGNAAAVNTLGLMYLNGHYVGKDEDKAAQYFFEAAEKGNVYAYCNLGDCYVNGWGTDVDILEAEKCYKIAADKDYASAQCNLGDLYNYNEQLKDKRMDMWTYYFSAAENGSVYAIYRLGVLYYNEGPTRELSLIAGSHFRTRNDLNKYLALSYINYAAEKGLDAAKQTVEEIKSKGAKLNPYAYVKDFKFSDIGRLNVENAAGLFSFSTSCKYQIYKDIKDPDALYELALDYYLGRKHYSKCVKHANLLFGSAASKGNVMARYYYAVTCYETKDNYNALRAFKECEDLGITDCYRYLYKLAPASDGDKYRKIAEKLGYIDYYEEYKNAKSNEYLYNLDKSHTPIPELLKKAADSGNAEALEEYAAELSKTGGDEFRKYADIAISRGAAGMQLAAKCKNYEAKRYCVEKAADSGDAEAAASLVFGYNVIDEKYLRIMENTADGGRLLGLAQKYDYLQNYKKAVELYERAVNGNGKIDKKSALKRMIVDYGVFLKDEAKAFDAKVRLAELDFETKIELGFDYYYGKGCKADKKKSYDILLYAECAALAPQKAFEVYKLLAIMTMNGEGTQPDITKALKFMNCAAEYAKKFTPKSSDWAGLEAFKPYQCEKCGTFAEPVQKKGLFGMKYVCPSCGAKKS